MITRRQFCTNVSSVAALGAASVGWARDAAAKVNPTDTDSAGGFCMRPPQRFLFTDLRHIDPGDLVWRGPDGETIPVAGPPEPSVDVHASVENMAEGIRLVAQPAKKEGPIEGLWTRVLFDGGVYRSWRIEGSYPPGSNLGSYSKVSAEAIIVHYGESKDGYQWQWREVCRVPVSGVSGIDGDYCFFDPHGPAQERYKCIYNARMISGLDELWKQYQRIHPRHRDDRLSSTNIFCLFGLVSPDGLNWRPIKERLLIHEGDTDNTVYYDEWLGKYVLYTRLYWLRRRMIARAESGDFHHWTPIDAIITPELDDPFSYDIYTNGRTNYPGLPEYHLMFPQFYRRYTQTSEVRLMSSLDGIGWGRLPGGPVLVPGDPGDWDGEYIYAGKDLIPLGPDRVAVPYAGYRYPHKYPRWEGVLTRTAGWASWPEGRLSALVADAEGEFRTFEVQVTGSQLRVDAKVRRAGELRVGLVGVDGRAVENCDPVTGNERAKTITWRNNADLGIAPGNAVRLHFRLRAAELYGFSWT